MPSFKSLVKVTTAIATAAVVMVAAFLNYTSQGQELVVKGKQYTTQNVDKNWGIKKNLLIGIDEILTLFSKSTHVEFDKLDSDAGARLKHSDLTEWLVQAKGYIEVTDTKELLTALRSAQAGDFIFIKPGKYTITDRTIYLGSPGKQGAPITVAGSQLGTVELQLNSFEGIYLDKPFWRFKNLVFRGICSQDARCEHAFHMVGDADYAVLENNKFINFNAAIKSNGNYSSQPYSFPDKVVLRNNDLVNESVRQTRSPSSPIDVVGGDDWLVEGNFIADFSRQVRKSHTVVYGAFFKGGGSGAVFQNNVVNCAWRLPHQSNLDIRIGFSLGNGGTADKYCQNAKCDYEHKNGKVLNNLILNCQNDVGMYLNRASQTIVNGNIILNSLGIDARYPETTGTLKNNTLNGRIKFREGSQMTREENVIKDSVSGL